MFPPSRPYGCCAAKMLEWNGILAASYKCVQFLVFWLYNLCVPYVCIYIYIYIWIGALVRKLRWVVVGGSAAKAHGVAAVARKKIPQMV